MAQAGILFWKKNKIDLDNDNVVITITDAVAADTGQDYVDLMRNRNNSSGWRTTDSTDAANTQIDIDMVDTHEIDTIILVEFNFKLYTIQYWNGSAYVNFSTTIAETTNALTTKRHTFNTVTTDKIRIIVTGCMIANEDKKVTQLILTKLMGQLSIEPRIGNPTFDQAKQLSRYVSGKFHVKTAVGAFRFSITKPGVIADADLLCLETLFDQPYGFLVALHGFDTTQFRTQRRGYRLKDIFYMKVLTNYSPEWQSGHFQHGTNVDMDLAEVN